MTTFGDSSTVTMMNVEMCRLSMLSFIELLASLMCAYDCACSLLLCVCYRLACQAVSATDSPARLYQLQTHLPGCISYRLACQAVSATDPPARLYQQMNHEGRLWSSSHAYLHAHGVIRYHVPLFLGANLPNSIWAWVIACKSP